MINKHKSKGISHRFQIRILAVYCILILLTFSGAIIAIRRVLLLRLDARIEQALEQEIQELQLLLDGKDPETAQPFGGNITAIFNVFLRRNIPISDEYTIALLPDGFYASEPSRLPSSIGANSRIVKHWQKLTLPERGEIGDSHDLIAYLAEPIRIDQEVKGVFVVAIATQNQLQEVDEAILIMIQVTAIAIAITSVLAWIFTGKILSPLRSLTKTARAISKNNLDQRIQVYGNDEVTQLSITFNEMLERLQSAFVNQQQFLSDVSHELKTPITIVQGHLDLMGDSLEEQEETKELIFDELERMNRLITDLSLLAKSEQPNFLQLEKVSLSTLTEEIYIKSQAIASRQWQLEAVGIGEILADRQRIVQAITNLAQNATKHTKPEDTIAIGSAINNNHFCLWVRDTGTGIAEEDRQRIFQRFQTVSKNHDEKSTGLGLSIVNAIAQAHRGKIELSSRLGKGSKFTIVLPLR
ncbi:Two-component sensor histidine kinase [Hyella patelloides LEGE 07179]|uniref:histidine kinase n=1 Tax=Hyella patelloides LEGE 07179 TaxID=945734 RepID=A0A563VKR3_9CYAN|nr:ATP-binding protein [Hyella patelloides]VEP12002.1 Two-component sensor histidine kinase [Hyella patelloides LEGE 07179]